MRRFADDRAGAMVHEEVRADLRARMQVHARAAMRPLGHDARNERDVLQIKLVRQPLHGDGLDERIRHDDFLLAQRRRVAVVGRLDVGLQQSRGRAAGCREIPASGCAPPGAGLFFGNSGGGLYSRLLRISSSSAAEHGVQQRRRFHLDFGGMNQLFVEETGEQQPQQVHA